MVLSFSEYRDLENKIAAVREVANVTQATLQEHLGVCAQRQGTIIADLAEIKRFLWKVGWGVFLGVMSAAGSLAMLVLDMKGFFDVH